METATPTLPSAASAQFTTFEKFDFGDELRWAYVTWLLPPNGGERRAIKVSEPDRCVLRGGQ